MWQDIIHALHKCLMHLLLHGGCNLCQGQICRIIHQVYLATEVQKLWPKRVRVNKRHSKEHFSVSIHQQHWVCLFSASSQKQQRWRTGIQMLRIRHLCSSCLSVPSNEHPSYQFPCSDTHVREWVSPADQRLLTEELLEEKAWTDSASLPSKLCVSRINKIGHLFWSLSWIANNQMFFCSEKNLLSSFWSTFVPPYTHLTS